MNWLNSKRMVLVVVGIVAAMVIGGGNAKADFTFGEPVNLESVIPVIDAADESITCFSSDGLEIYIESFRPGGQGDVDLWVLRRSSIDEDWGPPENLGPAVNSPQKDDCASISTDGLTLLFRSSRPGGYGATDIYATTRPTRDTPWGQAVNMGPPVNSSSYDGSAVMSADGLELYFSSIRSGGFGEYDLWVTTRAATDGAWGEPENLGPVVNSPYSELFFTLSPDGRVLFFSGINFETTHRPGGHGGADMWMTMRRTLLDSWQAPMNLGPKLNSSVHDLVFCVSPDGSTLHFATNSGSTWENWLSPIVPIVDFNGDGQVDGKDLLVMIAEFGGSDALCDIGPFAWGDGIVDLQDVVALAEYIGKEVTDPNLVAHWALDETEGSAAHESVSGRGDIVVGSVLWQPTGGQVDGALQFDGVLNCVATSFVLDPAEGPLSVLAWIKGGAPGQVIMSQAIGANWLMVDAEGRLMTELANTAGNNTPLLSDTIIDDGQWHRVGLIWDGLNRKLCVDDAVVAEDMQDGLSGSGNSLYIGAGKDMQSGSLFSGLIDDVRIYNRAVKP